jgi:hypothetical protein
MSSKYPAHEGARSHFEPACGALRELSISSTSSRMTSSTRRFMTWPGVLELWLRTGFPWKVDPADEQTYLITIDENKVGIV